MLPLRRLSLALLFFGVPAQAQDAVTFADHVCTLRVEDPGEPVDQASLVRLAPHTVTRVGGGSTFEVTYTGFTAEAEAAFQRAVDIWSDHIVSDVPIRVNAQFGPLASGVLGGAGPQNAHANQAAFPLPNTLYPDALADALFGASLGGTNPDINATFSSTFNSFYFGLDGDPPSNRFDFVTVVLHELGHGLGVFGSARADDGAGDPECTGTAGDGCWGFSGFPVVFDRFVEDGDGTLFLDEKIYPNPSQELGALLISDDLLFDGVTVTTSYDSEPQPVYGPNPFRAGSSFSHWDESAFPPTSSDAMMTPFISPGEAWTDPGLNTCSMFADIGWTLGPGCSFLVDDETAPAGVASALRVTSRNPGMGAARLTLDLAAPAAVRAELTDVLGRRLAVLFDAEAPAGALALATPAALAPGSYLVRVVASGEVQAARVVRL